MDKLFFKTQTLKLSEDIQYYSFDHNATFTCPISSLNIYIHRYDKIIDTI